MPRSENYHDLPAALLRRTIRDGNGCWIFTGAKRQGYGMVRVGSKVTGAHRLAYTALVGPIADGLQIDHLCRVKACVNPAHLEAVTPKENTNRGARHNRAKTHCKRGHPFDDRNTYLTRSGARQCRTCQREATRRYAQRKE